MASVALYGFAPSNRDGVLTSQANEVWSIVWAYKYGLPRLDRIVEIHPVWMQAASAKPEYVKPRQHWEWLKNNTTIPVYMWDALPEVPMSRRYPLREIAETLLPPKRRRSVFTSSFDFLMALAIYEEYERIEAYGFDMGSDTEYRYQREGAAYWIAQADARGIELVLPENTRLLRNKIYMYEGGAMIYRQDLERLKIARETQKRNAFARLNRLEGLLNAAVEAGDEERQKKYADAWDRQYRIALVAHGAFSECEYLLKEIDLEEPDEQLIDPFEFIPLVEA